MENFRLNGLTSGGLTPFNDNGELNLSVIDKYVDHIVNYGFQNVFVAGTSGEGNSLSVDERKQLAEKWISASKGRLSAVMVQVGSGCITDSVTLARHAQEAGADGIACVSPSYFKPDTIDSYVDYMQRVAAAAPNLPFYLYDIDFVTGVKFSSVEFFDAALPRIPTLKGVKHTTPLLTSMHTLVARYGDRIQVVYGGDALFLECLSIGVGEIIGPVYFGRLFNRIKQAFGQGDLETARREQFRAVEFGQIKKKYGNSPTLKKAILKMLLALDLGPPRLPFSAFSDSQVKSLNDDLNNIGFFEWTVAK